MFRTSTLAAAVVVAFLVPVSAAAQPAIAKQIEANERALNDAVAKADAVAFKNLVADSAISVDGSGAMPVTEFIKMLPQVKVASWAIDQVNVLAINDTTAFITYRWTGKGTMAGQAFPSPVYASTVWSNKGGSWVAVLHQESTALPPPPVKK